MKQGVQLEARQSSALTAYSTLLVAVAKSPAAWVFIVLYLFSNIYFILAGHTGFLLLSLYTLFFLVLTVLIVVPLTVGAPDPAWEEPLTIPRSRIWWQVGSVVLGIIALAIPVLSSVNGTLVFPLKVLLMIIFPLAVSILLGTRWGDLGFGRGYHAWRVAIALSIVPLALFIITVVVIKLPPVSLLVAPINYFIAAALPEEIAFRGILMTRLSRLLSMRWGIVLSSLLFGLTHVTAYLSLFHGDVVTSLAIGITFAAPAGIALAFVFQRTRNLLASIIFHGFIDTAGFALLPTLLPILLHH